MKLKEKNQRIDKIGPKLAKEILLFIRKRLPKKAQILCLSLTGSRAFGWANERYDYDIHGIFAAKNYWDWVHSGEGGFDINLYEFEHVAQDIFYQHFEFFTNLANPFYIHPKFDYHGLMKFCTFRAAKQYHQSIIAQIQAFEASRSPRAGLHAYRVLLIPIYFLKRKKIKLNVFEINKAYRFKQIENLKNAYLLHSSSGFDYEKVKRDLNFLLKEYDRLCKRKKDEKLSQEKINQWMDKMRKNFY